jgi:YbbR domain-containing protein
MKILLHHWDIKLLALVMALLTYYIIRGKTSVEVHYDIPLRVEVEQGIAVLDQDPQTVNVTFRGSQQDLRNLDQGRLRAAVRLKAAGPGGAEEVTLSRRNIEGAPDVVPVDIRPSRALVRFDREDRKTISLAPPLIRGRPLQGRVEVEYEPRTVSLRGPKSRLETADAFVEPVDVEGRADNFSIKARVQVRDPWIMEIEPPEIRVNVKIVRDVVTRAIDGVKVLPIIEQGEVSGIVVEPAGVKVTMSGQSELINSVADSTVRALVDCVGLSGPAQYTLPVLVRTASGPDVSVVSEPATVKVKIGAR